MYRIPERQRIFPAVFCLAVLFGAVDTAAQDLEPRRYVSIPVGQNFLRAAIGYSTGEVNLSPGLPYEDADLSMWGSSLAYLRTFDLNGNSSSFDAYLPYICADGSALEQDVRETRETCGLGDARLRFTYNFIGAPAISIDEFARREKEMVVGASVQLYLPTGQYDDTRVLNIGANRWVLRPEIGMSWPKGNWSFELSAGARFFADNDEAIAGTTLSQDPLYNLQIHVIYDFSRRQWLSMNSNYFFGGNTFSDDQPVLDSQENSRLGITWNIALDTRNVIQLTGSSGVITRVGNDSTLVSVAWLYRWD